MNVGAMKEKLGLILLAISVALLWILVSRSGTDPRLSSRIVGMKTLIYSMSKLKLVKTEAPGIFFNEEKLFYDEKSHTYYYSLIEGSDSALNPRIRIETIREDARAAFTSEITEELIENNTPILFSVYNDVGYELFYLRCTTLPMINIDCDIENLSSTEDEAMSLTLFDNREGAPRRIIKSEGLIHKRGGSSAHFPKRSYRISLKTDSLGGNKRSNRQSLLGMRQDDDWILYAGYSDPEKIRNVFSQNLWYESCRYDNDLKRSTGTEYKYFELFINSKYYGLYAICYPIDEKEMELNGNRLEQALYKYEDSLGDEVVINDYGRIGGIVVKYPGKEDSDDELAKYGDRADSLDYSLLFEYYDFLDRNRADNNELLYGIDLRNAMDITLFINMIQGEDHAVEPDKMANLFLALFKDEKGVKGLFAPWDMDRTWGNHCDESSVSDVLAYYNSPEENFILNCGYFAQIIKNDKDTYNRLLSEKYEILRHGAWSDDRIFEMLDEYEAQIFDSGAFLRDKERWPGGSFEEPKIKLSRFKEYVSERLEYCDNYYGIQISSE